MIWRDSLRKLHKCAEGKGAEVGSDSTGTFYPNREREGEGETEHGGERLKGGNRSDATRRDIRMHDPLPARSPVLPLDRKWSE